jgi:hypothetical protein
MTMNPNAALVARQLKERLKLTNAQIAGVLGNFSQESGFNPRVNEGGAVGSPLGKGGYGLAQWTGGRQTNLVNFAKQRKKDPGDTSLQADFLIHELEGPERSSLASLRGAVSPEQSALVFRRDFERAGVPKDENRFKAARNALGQLNSLGFDAQAAGPMAPPPVSADRRSVEEVLGAALGLASKPGLDAVNQQASSLLGDMKSALIKSLIPSIINPMGF